MELSMTMLTALGWMIVLALAVIIIILAIPILQPTIITFPWASLKKKEDRTVILAGSYNPPHLGHLAMLQYLSQRYTKVIAVVGFNPDKTYPVSPQARVALLEQMLQTTQMNNVQVQLVEGYIWRFARRVGATLFVRGIRDWERDGTDERALQILNTWGPMLLGPLVWPIPTVYLEGDPQYNHISSTVVRAYCCHKKKKELLSSMVPAQVTDQVTALYGPKKDDKKTS